MSFKFHCPHCNQKIEAEEEWIGQEAECPSCNEKITVLAPNTTQKLKILPAPNTAQKLKEDERKCPFCCKIIRKDTIMCPYCLSTVANESIEGKDGCGWGCGIISVILISVGCLLWFGWKYITNNNDTIDLTDPTAVAQMSIDSIMNEDYQLFLKIMSPELPIRIKETGWERYDDPLKAYFDYFVRVKHNSMPVSISTYGYVCDVEWETIKMEIKEPLKFIENYAIVHINLKCKILNVSTSPRYSSMRLPDYVESKSIMCLQQVDDGTWRVSLPPLTFPTDIDKIIEKILKNRKKK